MSELPLVRGTNLLPDCQKGLLFFKSVLSVYKYLLPQPKEQKL